PMTDWKITCRGRHHFAAEADIILLPKQTSFAAEANIISLPKQTSFCIVAGGVPMKEQDRFPFTFVDVMNLASKHV
ncbi:MAG: hypothetical protein AAF703_22970, partial [Cyanobacteria bacterium P01_D01_bin.105]